MTRPAFGGNTIATIACPDFRPQMATVRPGVMQKSEKVAGRQAEIVEFNPGFTPDRKYVQILEIVKDTQKDGGYHGCEDPRFRRPWRRQPRELQDPGRPGSMRSAEW
jgi:hypothetical protein